MSKHSVDPSSKRLLELSNDVRRIAASLAEPATERRAPQQANDAAREPDASEVSAELVSWAISARRNRAHYFPGELFADPAWDMLLDLLEAELRQRRVCVSSLCIAAGVPASTALRWIKSLVEEGLFVRIPDPNDLRRVYVELSPAASNALRLYFAELNLGV